MSASRTHVDERGMLRLVDDAKRAEALAGVREGRLYDLGHVLDESVPVFPGRYFRQTLVTTAHHTNGMGVGDNRVNWITEVVSGTQQLGTHLDALSHLQEGGQGYGGTGAYGGSGSAVIGVAGGAAQAGSNATQDSSRDVAQFFGEKLR